MSFSYPLFGKYLKGEVEGISANLIYERNVVDDNLNKTLLDFLMQVCGTHTAAGVERGRDSACNSRGHMCALYLTEVIWCSLCDIVPLIP